MKRPNLEGPHANPLSDMQYMELLACQRSCGIQTKEALSFPVRKMVMDTVENPMFQLNTTTHTQFVVIPIKHPMCSKNHVDGADKVETPQGSPFMASYQPCLNLGKAVYVPILPGNLVCIGYDENFLLSLPFC
jgi:hypothetical protein